MSISVKCYRIINWVAFGLLMTLLVGFLFLIAHVVI